jgi:hypothetical protein
MVYFKPLNHRIIEDILVSIFLKEKVEAKTFSRIANGNLEQAIRLAGDTNQESRHLLITFIESVLNADDLFIINTLATGKDRFKADLVHDLLFHLAIWLNDLVMLSIGSKDIISIDHMELLQRCIRLNSDWENDIINSLKFFDELHNKVDGNVNTQYIVINLYNHLKNLFHKN